MTTNDTLVSATLAVCELIGHNRPEYQPAIMLSVVEEVGELAAEIKIARGIKNKPIGVDGVTGEAIDLIVCALDIIFSENPGITEAEILAIAKIKLQKWVNQSNNEAATRAFDKVVGVERNLSYDPHEAYQ